MSQKTTIAEFKRRMKPGSKWSFLSNYCPTLTERTCTHKQTNMFALTSIKNKEESSWCSWPSKKEATITFENDKICVLIKHDCGWLQYIEN